MSDTLYTEREIQRLIENYHLPLDRAMLCADCSTIYALPLALCPSCTSASALPIAKVLDADQHRELVEGLRALSRLLSLVRRPPRRSKKEDKQDVDIHPPRISLSRQEP